MTLSPDSIRPRVAMLSGCDGGSVLGVTPGSTVAVAVGVVAGVAVAVGVAPGVGAGIVGVAVAVAVGVAVAVAVGVAVNIGVAVAVAVAVGVGGGGGDEPRVFRARITRPSAKPHANELPSGENCAEKTAVEVCCV